MDKSCQSSLSNDESGSDEEPNEDEDAFCDLSDYTYSNEILPMHSTAESLENEANRCVSEDLLREDIEKVEILRPEEVRWFYCTKKKKKLKPLVGYDSIRLEETWRQFHWKNSGKDVCRVGIRGGMYEADVTTMRCYPVYWSTVDLKSDKPEGDVIIRGSWFFEVNWQPVEEELAKRIETEHVERWKGYDVQQIKELMCNKVMHSVQLGGCHVEWNSVTDVLFYKDATTHRAFRNIVQKFGVSKATSGGYRLRRGYFETAIIKDCIPPVSHLVLVIHGIGAKSDRRKIVRNTAEFRSVCRRLRSKHFSERCEFIPVEWRSRLILDGDIVETITPKKGQGVRRFLNNTAMDIMYYASPLYRCEIVNALSCELNRIYDMFMTRNPKFDGKINVFAHSLGNVIFRDILAEWNSDSSYGEYHQDGNTKQQRSQNRLKFRTDTLFSVGSPLGVFLCLRGYRPEKGPRTRDDIIPASLCRRIFNIFHPADPVAYRLEPLIFPHYSDISPEQICCHTTIKAKKDSTASSHSPTCNRNEEFQEDSQSHDSSETTDSVISGEKSPFPSDSATIARQQSYLRSMSVAVAGGAARIGRGFWSRARGSSEVEEDCPTTTASTSQLSSKIDESPFPNLEKRIDYELPEGFTESKLGYASLTSHTSYWSNQDLATFIMSRLHERSVEYEH